MFKSYFKTAWRNLWKNRIYSILNITGLAIGMAACMLILIFVMYERSFDNFHTKNIYRLNEVQQFEGMVSAQKVALTMFPMGPTLKNEFPEVKNYTRISRADKMQLRYGDKKYYIDQACFVDSTFLSLFDFTVKKGDRNLMLDRKNSIVLNEATARKIFGQEDPLGKTLLSYDLDTTLLVVTGVLDNVPQNSQLQFDALVPFSTIARANWMDNWGGNWLNTYLELAPNANPAALQRKFPDYLKKHLSAQDVPAYQLFLLPLKEVHAGATDIGLDNFNYQQFDKRYTHIFFIIALIVLLIACVNFVNLSTARSAERAREVGVRKSLGALHWQLSLQFLFESVMLSLLAMIVAVILVVLFLPLVNHLSQRHLHFPLFSNWRLVLSLLSATIVLGIFSGVYPAVYLSSFLAVKVLKGAVRVGKNKALLRNVLVVTQFSCAVFLIIATVFVLRQLNYMKNKPTGFNRDQIVNLSFDRGGYQKFDVLKKDLLQSTLISSVTASQDVLGSHLDQSGVQFKGNGPTRQLAATRLIVDHDYLSTYQIPLVAGRNFSPDKTAGGKEYIVNESLARELLEGDSRGDFSVLLGKQFGFDSLGRIVGVAKDFNFNSLHHKIETLFMFNQSEWGFRNMSVKIDGNRPKEAISFIQSVWKRDCPETPLEYQFLDEHFEELYRTDSQVSSTVGTLAILAIIVSCLGLFGLASYSAERRFKEIGIRKVLGASVPGVVALLSQQFVGLVIMANVIAWPVAWLALSRWLQDYAYRVNISWWVFAVAGIASLLIALITVSAQAIKAAIANPVRSLRTE